MSVTPRFMSALPVLHDAAETADLLRRRNREQQEKARAKHEEEGGEPADGAAEVELDREATFSVVYEPNGRCDPYLVKIWKDGASEDKAMTLEVGRFGRVVEDEER